MKRCIYMVMFLLVLVGCGKLGKDGRIKKQIDYSDWYFDDASQDSQKPGVMVMSFNIRYLSGEDTGVKAWENRRNGCYEMLNTLRPALVGLQECQGSQRADLEINAPDYGFVGVSRDGSINGEQMAIMYLKDSVSVQEWGTFWLTDTPDVVSKHPSAGNYRCATWARVRHNRTSAEFYFIDTHLDLVDDIRRYEMFVILDFIAGKCGEQPVVMTADWNENEDSDTFTEMYQTFSNARWTARTGDAYGTYSGFTNMNSSTKIDHIFYRGFSACAKFVTVRQKWAGYQFISDHFPVYANLKF